MIQADVFQSKVLGSIESVIFGKKEKIQLALTCWLAGGHLLIEDLPGTGKTILARSIATTVEAPFRRIQFTPDLLPSDIIGASVFNQKNQEFEFIKGPLFTTVLLADELNRATPRTQSALLEAMAEIQITSDGKTYDLPESFFVIATQNPIEQVGTFPLPEAQMDRFLMRMGMGYPERGSEIEAVKQIKGTHPVNKLSSVTNLDALKMAKEQVNAIEVHDKIYDYSMRIVEETRRSDDLLCGSSTRGFIGLINSSKAYAWLQGDKYVKPSHIYHLAGPVLAHRLVLKPEVRLTGIKANDVVKKCLQNVPSPG